MQCLSKQKQFGAYSNTQCRLNPTYKRQFSTSLHPKTVQDIFNPTETDWCCL